MKRQIIKSSALLVFTLLIFNIECHAEKNPFYFGFTLMHSLENLDSANTEKKYEVPVDIDFDNSFGFQFRAGLIFNEFFSAEAMFEYIFPFEDDGENQSSEIDVINIGINGKAKYQTPSAFQPYFLVGLGLVNSKEETKYKAFSTSQTNWGFSTKLGIGLDIFITPKLFTGLGLSHTFGIGNVDYVKYTNLSLGINYRF